MSTLDPDNEPSVPENPPGHDENALGPGDSSDTGSDMGGAKRHEFDRDTELDEHALESGEEELRSDTDRSGTGERAAADGDENLRPDDDVLPDEIEEAPPPDDDDLPDEIDENPSPEDDDESRKSPDWVDDPNDI